MAKYTPQLIYISFLGLFVLIAILVEFQHPGFAIRIINKAFWLMLGAILLIKVSHEKK